MSRVCQSWNRARKVFFFLDKGESKGVLELTSVVFNFKLGSHIIKQILDTNKRKTHLYCLSIIEKRDERSMTVQGQ